MDFEQISRLTLQELGLNEGSSGIVSSSILASIAVENEKFASYLYSENGVSSEQLGKLLATPVFKRMLVLKVRELCNNGRPASITAGAVLEGWQKYDQKFLASGICHDRVQRHFHLCTMNGLFAAMMQRGADEGDFKGISSANEILIATFD